MKALLISTLIIFVLLSSYVINQKGSESETNSVVSNLSDTTGVFPYLFQDTSGKILASWISEESDSMKSLLFSVYENNHWMEPQIVAKGTNWFVNWADFPIIVSDGKGNVLSHYLAKSSHETYSYDIHVVLSNDYGKTWNKDFVIHSDGTYSEHGFLSAIPYEKGFLLVWLDGRKTVDQGPMTLRSAYIDQSGNVIDKWEIDNRVCDCCQTSISHTENGPMVVYRNRSEDEIRDIGYSSFINGSWTEPKILYPDNWEIHGCPVNGPEISTSTYTAVAWFTMDNDKGKVQVTINTGKDGVFIDPIILSANSDNLGRVDVKWISEELFIVSWLEWDTIKAVKLNTEGDIIKKYDLVTTSRSRSSGFPRILIRDGQLLLANTDSRKGMSLKWYDL